MAAIVFLFAQRRESRQVREGVNAKLKCPLFCQIEMSPFGLFVLSGFGKRERVRPKAKSRGAVGN